MKWDIKSFLGGIVVGSVLFSGIAIAAPAFPNAEEGMKTPFTYYFDGLPKSPNSDIQGIMYKNSVYVPIRFVAENLNKSVIYDARTKSIFIGKIPTTKMYSKMEAIELVKKKFAGKLSPTHVVEYTHDDEKGHYVIQVYQTVVNNFQSGDSYTSTYGWFVVNPNTGEIKPLL
ncbi:copper amine oxidase N-terminal domain-containing protein [Brevibacillus antibioticus]|uniref:Copper amine oxidase N-terminal domain-containing protein n=1 Tax=Brevibacillus antibioticus TaxID=2570228 RepID=A0A4U2YCE8_9BACL|nr:stalk domain-containing protein [Brevibacillus antibioticus]TKI58449.1 copper amine oxidase N-terminal domain-containing protein [Brevibacillus antibioticus]